MPKITFIGAGSTVFARNLLGDILGHPELRDSTRSRCSTSTPSGCATSEIVARRLRRGARRAAPTIEATHRPPRRARRRRLRVINMIQVGGYEPSTVDRLRGPEAVTACARRSPTRSASAGSCAGCARSRCCSTCAATWRSVCPDALLLQLRQPDGDATAGRSPRRSPIRTVGLCHSVQGTAGELAADLGMPTARSTTSPPASTTWRSTCGSSATARTLPGAAASSPTGRVPDGQPGALRDAASTSATSSPSRASTSPSTCRGSSSATGPT